MTTNLQKRPPVSPQIYSPLHSHQKLIIQINVNLATTGDHFSFSARLVFKLDSENRHCEQYLNVKTMEYWQLLVVKFHHAFFEIGVLKNVIDVNGYIEYAKKNKTLLHQIIAFSISFQKTYQFCLWSSPSCGFHPVFTTLRYICLW